MLLLECVQVPKTRWRWIRSCKIDLVGWISGQHSRPGRKATVLVLRIFCHGGKCFRMSTAQPESADNATKPSMLFATDQLLPDLLSRQQMVEQSTRGCGWPIDVSDRRVTTNSKMFRSRSPESAYDRQA